MRWLPCRTEALTTAAVRTLLEEDESTGSRMLFPTATAGRDRLLPVFNGTPAFFMGAMAGNQRPRWVATEDCRVATAGSRGGQGGRDSGAVTRSKKIDFFLDECIYLYTPKVVIRMMAWQEAFHAGGRVPPAFFFYRNLMSPLLP